MTKKILTAILILLLVSDLSYSFLQYYNTPFDGDMAAGIVPAEDVEQILQNPLGLKIFYEDVIYPNPNRFFSHWSFYEYFNRIPLLLQNFTDPLNSAYLSCAIIKIIIQIVFTVLLAIAITGNSRILRFDFLLAAVLITPFFQTNGYRAYMGIIDSSTTYTFFYALPAVLLLLYFIPMFLERYYSLKLHRFRYFKILWIPLALICSLSGPLNPGIALVIVLLLLIYHFDIQLKENESKSIRFMLVKAIRNIPPDYYFYLLPIGVFSIYSLFLGSFNSVNVVNERPLAVMYTRIPEGIYYLLTLKPGVPVLLSILVINIVFIRSRFKAKEGKRILNFLNWFGLFVLLYVLLLPLGGSRDYRHYIIRYDTLIPVTLGLIFIIGETSLFIIQQVSRRQMFWYLPVLILVLFIFTLADEPGFNKNNCEKNAISRIAQADTSIVKVTDECKVLSWFIIREPGISEIKAQLLKKWNIVQEDKLYYQGEMNYSGPPAPKGPGGVN